MQEIDGGRISNYLQEISDTGIMKSTFTDWERGRSKPKTEKLKILADYFGVSVDYFLEQSEHMCRKVGQENR